jgi:tRNA-Thr(GGU) m(6)t(6)A37 methyltransferase TsaA
MHALIFLIASSLAIGQPFHMMSNAGAASPMISAALSVVSLVAVTAATAIAVDRRYHKRGRPNKEINQGKRSNIKDIADVVEHGSKSLTSSESPSIVVEPIGHVSSVYRLCVGTPRQGMLAPDSRGRIVLDPLRITPDAVLELDNYSHVWVVFAFHLNSKSKKNQVPSKVAPPALGGKKVGILATRTPHRPNPIGFSLVKLEGVVKPNKKMSQPFLTVLISGLDLVDGTPVLDIKPYVPHYDSVGYIPKNPSFHEIDNVKLNVNGMIEELGRVPPWVSGGLDKRRTVVLSNRAEKELQDIVLDNAKALEFYGASWNKKESPNQALDAIRRCLDQVLAADVRSAWQTGKARKGKSQAERASRVRNILPDAPTDSINEDVEDESNWCTQQLDNLLIKYSVTSTPGSVANSVGNNNTTASNLLGDGNHDMALAAQGSGADDLVTVESIEQITKTS